MTILTTGETAMHKLGAQIPDGTVLGARGPFGPYAPNNAYNKWFAKRLRGEVQGAAELRLLPDGAGDPRREAGVGEGAGRQRRQAAEQRAGRARRCENATFEGPGGTVRMAIGKGHQAIMETVYGTTKLVGGKLTLVNVKRYPAEQGQSARGRQVGGLDQERLQEVTTRFVRAAPARRTLSYH